MWTFRIQSAYMLINVLTLLTILTVFMHVKGGKNICNVNYEYLNAKIIMNYLLAFISVYSYCVSALKCFGLLSHRIPPNVRDIVYCTGVSLMDEDVWEFIWMKFHSSTAISEKKVLLEALTCSDNIFLLNRSVDILKLH